jgi:hypothetical protein
MTRPPLPPFIQRTLDLLPCQFLWCSGVRRPGWKYCSDHAEQARCEFCGDEMDLQLNGRQTCYDCAYKVSCRRVV